MSFFSSSLIFLFQSLKWTHPPGMARPPRAASLCSAAMGDPRHTVPSGRCQMPPCCCVPATATGSNARGNSAQKDARFPPSLSSASNHPGWGPGVMSSSPMCRSRQTPAVGRPACCGRRRLQWHPGSTHAFLWATPCIVMSCNCCDWNVTSRSHLCGPWDDSTRGHWAPSPWATPPERLQEAREATYCLVCQLQLR